MKNPLISIIIPVKKINDYIRETVPILLSHDYSNIEILIFPDEKDETNKWPKTRIVPSGKCGPATKRDMAIKYANGEILAFLDDDAYPEKGWLKNAIIDFDDGNVAAVGGPAITPESDGIWQKLSGTVWESYFGGGTTRNRYLPEGKKKEIVDWPTVNLLVRKKVFEVVGGFDSTFWPGEDTKLCLDIINLDYKIIYDPECIVYHHRRANLLNHFRQTGNYGLHRGHFARIYPQTSRRLEYFLPTLFLGYVISIFFVRDAFNYLWFLPITIYSVGTLMDGLVASYRWKNILFVFLTPLMIFFTHLWYGARFVQGFLSKTLPDSKLK